jgi:hypothetical protein
MFLLLKRFIILLLIHCFSGAVVVYSQSKEETRASVSEVSSLTYILPRKFKPLEVKTALSIMFTRIPVDWVETSVDVPIFQFGARIGMPAGFTLDANIQSVYFSNQLRLGSHWNLNMGKISASIGVDGSFMYGRMTIADFNNEASGWSAYPNLSLGFNTRGLAFTLTGEFDYLISLKITSGEAEISHEKTFSSGRTISLYLEQRLWKNHIMILGFVNNFQKFFYPAWPAFSAFNRRYYIPQFYMGIVL